MNFKTLLIGFFVLLLILWLTLTGHDNNKTAHSDKKSVACSTLALYDITKNIAGDTVSSYMILPFGVDIHSFEASPKLMAKIQSSDLVLLSGAGLESWLKGFSFPNKVIDMSKHVKLISFEKSHHDHEDDEHHHEGEYDPHYWLDIQNMIMAAKTITKELIALEPQNKEQYQKNEKDYIVSLQELAKKYKTKLSQCSKKTVVVNHNAFSYLAKDYGFEVESLYGLSPDAQPSAKDVAKIITHVKEDNLSVIFFESFASDKVIKTISKEANVSVDVLQPGANITADEAKKGISYMRIMEENLDKLSLALDCK